MSAINKSPTIQGNVIIDTGSGVHIVGRRNILKENRNFIYKVQNPLSLSTANGTILSRKWLNLSLESQKPGSNIAACVLKDSPNVLSVGQVCQQGWKFIWDRIDRPKLIAPNKEVFHLSVRNFVPHLSEKDQLVIRSRAELTKESSFLTLPAVGASSSSAPPRASPR